MKKSKLYKALMNVMSKLMLSCESAGILLCIQQQDKLNLRQKAELRLHLLSCKLCRRFEDDLGHIHNGISHYTKGTSAIYSHHHLSEDQKNKIAQSLESQANS